MVIIFNRWYNLKFAFFLALFPALFCPIFVPALRFTFFAPYLIVFSYRRPLIETLWQSFACGLILDLLSSHPCFGLTPLSYCLTTALLFKQKRHFFEDKLSSLPLMTALFAVVSTLFQSLLLPLFGYAFPLSPRWIVTDLVGMPIFDGIYALLWFSFPFQIYTKLRKLQLYASFRKRYRRRHSE